MRRGYRSKGQDRGLSSGRRIAGAAVWTIALVLSACSAGSTSKSASQDPPGILQPSQEQQELSGSTGSAGSAGDAGLSGRVQFSTPAKQYRFIVGQSDPASPIPAPAATTDPASPLQAAAPVPAPAPTQTPTSPAASVKSKKPAIPVQRQQEQQAKRKLTLGELRHKYSDIFKVNGQPGVKRIALTFDDGPDQLYTPQILDVLKAHQVKATFFLLGKRAEANPNIVQRIVQEGHVIGNHSYSHPLFTKLSVEEYKQQIDRTSAILQAQIGYTPKLIRPPYGEITEEQLQWTGSNRYVIVNWNIDSLDWKGLSADQVSHNIISHARGGAIVLQHSAGGDKQNLSGTVAALSTVISKIKADGYELVTVPQLLKLSKQM
ncbi:polysaccharide deacetylase family protein [Paenibacillus sp. HJGM_3]|uniref:polysaccharide deacetylase family protein n=1 Tax=Paenibacillus sp. HJGM_3 TaxID=3379816 RepID=UPI00385E059C